MKPVLKSLSTRPTRALSLIGVPFIAILASCSITSTPVAHRHGDLVHSHVRTQTDGNAHKHDKSGKKKAVMPIKSAKAADIKPLGLKGIGHKHHTHVKPDTGKEGVPC